MASSIMGAVLVPALALMKQSLEISRETDTNNTMITLCVSKMEEQLAEAAASFTETTSSGTFASEGYPDLHYQVLRSTNSTDGGIVDQLMAITVLSWHDLNSNGSQDSNEPEVSFSTKIAKMAVYQSNL